MIYISIKVNIIHIFHMNIHSLITFFHRRFMYIHTFFHRQIMCGCRMITCLYDIRQTSYERRLHYNHVAPSEPIWAEFAPILGNIYPQLIRAATSQQSCHSRFAPRDHNIYAHICRGKWRRCNLHTRTWENPTRFFSRRAIICTVYCWEKCKNCKVCSCLCALDPSIFHFIWVKHSWKNMAVRAV